MPAYPFSLPVQADALVQNMSGKRTGLVCALMLLAAVLVRLYQNPPGVPPNKPLGSFPTQIGEWVGRQEHFQDNVLNVLGVDDYFSGVYQAADGQRVELYVGFYEKQSFGDQIHSPRNCMPGAGWRIISNSTESIAMNDHAIGNIEARKLVLEKEGKRLLMLYWFKSGNRTIASEYMQRIYIVYDAITRHRTDGALVRIIAPILDETDGESLTERYVRHFARLLIPILDAYIPL